jgi:2,4-dienoyl-CoA reductase-like NADH-dependent reductase (Old Yellow Enzyme family)
MSALFSPFTLRGVTLPNRIVVSPMCQYSAVRGEATAWHMIHLGHLALSGAGMLCLEATSVEPDGRITPGDLGLWDDVTEAALKPVIDAIRQYSHIAITMQISHAGRKASSAVPWEGGQLIEVSQGGWLPSAPSAIPHKEGETPPLALDAAGLIRIREAFVATAKRAARLGVDALEVHAAHGDLLHQFLSPLANQRTDEYGGSLENRMRFPLEVFDAVRAVFPADRPVTMRVSGTDWADGGWDIEQTLAFSVALEKRGCSAIHVSSGGLTPAQQIPMGPNYQVPLARAVKQAVKIPVIAVGLITEFEQAEAIIGTGDADLIALARAMLYDPRWPWHAAAHFGERITAPDQYLRCQPHTLPHLFDAPKG